MGLNDGFQTEPFVPGAETTRDPFAVVSPRQPAFEWLRFGDVKPSGWLRLQIKHDLEDGFVGHLDELVPQLIRDDDIYGGDRLTAMVQRKNLGVVSSETAWEIQYQWWNSETQSNWRDGMVRSAILLEHKAFLPLVREYVERILTTQDADGYMGIYSPDTRFKFQGENGELWAQATLFRVLLGYYEWSRDERVLQAVERAVSTSMRAYPIHSAHPFAVQDSHAGVCHGLMFSDTLDRLYDLTDKNEYRHYSLWLYEEYSLSNLSENDIQYSNLVDPTLGFRGHAVHTYEHLRALLTAFYASGNPLLEEALRSYLAKLEPCLTPSGGPIGAEYIVGRQADPSETGYEYCSLHELFDSYTHLVQKSGALGWADRAEWLLFNAAQGARHPRAAAIAYLKTDNSSSMLGKLHPDDVLSPTNPQTRYKYSPVHQDVAVCCVPNAGRINPYYVKAMWMRSPRGLVATLYGSCEVSAIVNGVTLQISERTNYPFDLDIELIIAVSQPVDFEIALRKPGWALGYQCTIEGVQVEEEHDGLIVVRRVWHDGERLQLRFTARVAVSTTRSGERIITYGPLLYALPLTGQLLTGREYPLPGFVDLYYTAEDEQVVQFSIPDDATFEFVAGNFDANDPWCTAPALICELYDERTQQRVRARLIPLGATILRQSTFVG